MPLQAGNGPGTGEPELAGRRRRRGEPGKWDEGLRGFAGSRNEKKKCRCGRRSWADECGKCIPVGKELGQWRRVIGRFAPGLACRGLALRGRNGDDPMSHPHLIHSGSGSVTVGQGPGRSAAPWIAPLQVFCPDMERTTGQAKKESEESLCSFQLEHPPSRLGESSPS